MTMTEPSTAELAAEVAALRAELSGLRRQLAGEVHTQRLIVEDGLRSVKIEPGSARLHHGKTDAPDTGSFVHLDAHDSSAAVNVGQHLHEPHDGDSRLRATMNVTSNCLRAAYIEPDRGWIGDADRESVSVAVNDEGDAS